MIKEEHTMPAERKRNKREVPFTHDEKRIAGVSVNIINTCVIYKSDTTQVILTNHRIIKAKMFQEHVIQNRR